jgi:hypothetical protein
LSPDNTSPTHYRECGFDQNQHHRQKGSANVPKRSAYRAAPSGGLQATEKTQRKWDWQAGYPVASKPLRCKPEQWYIARAFPADSETLTETCVTLVTFDKHGHSTPEVVPLRRPEDDRWPDELLGWVKTPLDAHQLSLVIPDDQPLALESIELHPVAELDPKCHPLAHLPRWESHRPPFEISRIILPASLEPLVEHLGDLEVAIVDAPASKKNLIDMARHSAVILDPEWFPRLELDADALDELARESWVIVDLQSLADALRTSGRADARVKTRIAQHEIISARNVYADVPTRGTVMQDAVPFCTRDEQGNFSLRVLVANRAWKKYADQVGFATLLQSETDEDKKSGDVILAACPVGGGELIATDLPWMVAGDFGPLLAPRVARHLLRMTCGAPLSERVLFWNHWSDTSVILRDIADLPRRYTHFRTLRWASDDSNIAALGLSFAAETPRRHLILQTGRIDRAQRLDGLPAEAMISFMKYLEREWREQTDWGRRFLTGWRITWQFESASGLRNVVEYDSAQGVRPEQPTTYLAVRTSTAGDSDETRSGGIEIPISEGILGDESLAAQEILTDRLCDVIEQLQR